MLPPTSSDLRLAIYADNNSIADASQSGITDKYQYLVSLFSKVTVNLTMRVKVKLQISI